MGMFVGAVVDNFDERIKQKIFHVEIIVDNARVATETKTYRPIPIITNFVNDEGVNRMREMVKENYDRIKADAHRIVEEEIKRIEDNPGLCHLSQKKEQ